MNKLLLVLLLVSINVQSREVVTTYTKEQICVVGYSKTVRPSVSEIAKWKRKHIAPDQVWTDYVVDHIVPLSVGGAPIGNNLQLQTHTESKAKDILENRAHKDLCSNKITLKQAQDRF